MGSNSGVAGGIIYLHIMQIMDVKIKDSEKCKKKVIASVSHIDVF